MRLPYFLKERSVRGTAEGLLLALPLSGLLFISLTLGFRLSLVNFTYGAKGLDPAAKAGMLLALGGWIAGMYVWEMLFRGMLLRGLLKKIPVPTALLIHQIVINLVVIPLLWKDAVRMEGMGVFRFYLCENIFEGFLALYFLRNGSLLANAILHGTANFIRFVLINDVAGPFETFYFYSTASDSFYWLAAANFAVVYLIQLGMNLRWGARETSQ